MLTSRQFAKRVGIHLSTLLRLEGAYGFYPKVFTPGGHRRYSEEQIEEYWNLVEQERVKRQELKKK